MLNPHRNHHGNLRRHGAKSASFFPLRGWVEAIAPTSCPAQRESQVISESPREMVGFHGDLMVLCWDLMGI